METKKEVHRTKVPPSIFKNFGRRETAFSSAFLLIFFLAVPLVLGQTILLGVAALILFLAFYFFRAYSFSRILSGSPLRVDTAIAMRLFLVCDFVEVATFSGQLGSDAAKLVLLGKRFGAKIAVGRMALFRIVTTISILFSLGVVLNPLFAAVLIFALPFYFSKYRRIVLGIWAALTSDLIRILLFEVILLALGIPPAQSLVLSFAGGLAVFVPQGFIVQEAVFGIAALPVLGLAPTALILLLQRLLTIVPSATVGFFFAGEGALASIRQLIRNKRAGKKIGSSLRRQV